MRGGRGPAWRGGQTGRVGLAGGGSVADGAVDSQGQAVRPVGAGLAVAVGLV